MSEKIEFKDVEAVLCTRLGVSLGDLTSYCTIYQRKGDDFDFSSVEVDEIEVSHPASVIDGAGAFLATFEKVKTCKIEKGERKYSREFWEKGKPAEKTRLKCE